ncbi:MAG: N-formylglutamate amidohydrolase [Patescibacteria group bacterium]
MKYYNQIKKPRSSLIFTCEHASDVIPSEYSNLGLTIHELKYSKDLFDPGSLLLASDLAQDFNASLLYTKFSRLLIDANRFLGAETNKNNTYHAAALKTELLIEDAKGERLVTIQGNKMENLWNEETYRWDKYVSPYYRAIEKLAQQNLKNFGQVYIFQIHSFYPKYNGEVRKIDIGVIHNKLPLAKRLIYSMRNTTKLCIGDNEPWGMKAVGGGLLEPLQKRRGISVIGLDINNKLLRKQKDILRIKNILANAIRDMIF